MQCPRGKWQSGGWIFLVLLLIGGVTGCQTTPGNPDGAATDAGAPDGGLDGATTDGEVIDGGVPDAGNDGGDPCGPGRVAGEWGCDVDWLAPPGDLADSEPIVLDGVSGQVIEDLRISGAAQSAITLRDCADIVVQNVELSFAGNDGIRIENCTNVTVRNSYIHDTNQAANLHNGYAVFLTNMGSGGDVDIIGNWFEDCAGGVRLEWSDGMDGFRVRANFHKNAHRVDGGSQGQMFIAASSAALPGVRVTDNITISAPGEASNGDHINFYRAGGTASDSARVERNRIRGNSDSRSACGIILGDTGSGGTSPASAYVIAADNILVDPANVGLCLTGGHDHVLVRNRVFSSRNRPDVEDANVGIAVWRQLGEPGTMYDNTVGGVGQENIVLFWGNFRGGGLTENPRWSPSTGSDDLPPNNGTLAEGNVDPSGWDQNDYSATAWDADGGDAGYGELWDPAWNTWSHFAGP